jgi:tyrosine-protein phosphatase SIW14
LRFTVAARDTRLIHEQSQERWRIQVRFNYSRIRTRTSLAAFVLSLPVAAPAMAEPQAGVAETAAKLISRIRIDNFGQVNSSYFRGGQPKDRDYTDLAAIGVKTLINLTSDDADAREEALARQAGMKYVQIPMTTHIVPTPAELAKFLAIVNDPASQPIYVHCVGGRHRTGVMTAVYRMTHDGWSADQAFSEMKKYKFGADFLHPEFKSFVYSYASTIAKTALPAAATPAVATAKPVAGGGF